MSDPLYKVRLLGVPSLDGPDGIGGVPPARTQSLVLIARLAVGGETGASRGKLAMLFWPDSSREAGRRALSNLLYQTRKILGRDAIEGDRESVRLRADRFDIDQWRFHRAIEAGDLEAAVGEYGGPFLDGIRISGLNIEHWVEAERQALLTSYLGAIETLAKQAAGRSNAGRAAHWWRMAVNENPLHSGRTCELMLWLARSGDPAGAIKLARRHTSMREDELGLGPEPAVDLLVERIRTGEESVLSSLTDERDILAMMNPPAPILAHGHSVAVLPFVDLTSDGSVPHISHGFAISLSHRLSRVAGVTVAASSSAAALARQSMSKSEIATKLGVRSLLEGSIRRTGDWVEVTAQLIDAASGYQDWSESITGAIDDLLTIENRIGLAVVHRFLASLPTEGGEAMTRSVHEHYLRGLFLESQVHWDSTDEAVAAFEGVARGAPDFADGCTALARGLVRAVIGVRSRSPAAALERALVYADRALVLAPSSGDAHAAYGLATLFGRWDLMGARRAIYRATSLGIRHSVALSWASATLSLCGDSGAATALGAEAVSRDPFGYGTRLNRSWIARCAETRSGQFTEALVGSRLEGFWGAILWALAIPEDVEKVTALTQAAFDSDVADPLPVVLAVAARAQAGDLTSVATALSLAESFTSGNDTRHTERALVLSAAGRQDEAGAAFVEALKNREPNALLFWRDPLIRRLLQRPDVSTAANSAGLLLNNERANDPARDERTERIAARLRSSPG